MAYLERFTAFFTGILVAAMLSVLGGSILNGSTDNNVQTAARTAVAPVAQSASRKQSDSSAQSGSNTQNIQRPDDFRLSPAAPAQNLNVRINLRERENHYAVQLDQSGIQMHPGSQHRTDSTPTARTSRHCKAIVYQTLMNLPYSHRSQLAALTLFYTKDGRRGLGGGGSIILRCLNMTDGELASVLVHEIGHLVDGSLLVGSNGEESGFYDFEVPVEEDDPSLAFYRINWASDKKLLTDSSRQDFVSIYAMTDPFEDFAETYVFYRLHGLQFKFLADSNAHLRQKYVFMKNYVFYGEEFDTDRDAEFNANAGADANFNAEANAANAYSDARQNSRAYDATVLPFPLRNFLNM